MLSLQLPEAISLSFAIGTTTGGTGEPGWLKAATLWYALEACGAQRTSLGH
jgi:hypothetical protein